jgi:hypothetical protein
MKQVKITFGVNSENGQIYIKNLRSELSNPLNIDLGITNTGIIAISGFQGVTEDKLFVIGGNHVFKTNTSELVMSNEINDVDGEIYIMNRLDGVLSNAFRTFSILIEVLD